MKSKINYVKYNREDAIGKVTEMHLKYLKGGLNKRIFNLEFRGDHKFNTILVVVINISNLFKGLKKDEIVHFEEPKMFDSIINVFMRYKKSVLTVHHLEQRKYKLDPFFFLAKLKHRSFSKLIAISEKTKQDLINKYKINPAKIEVVYHGIDKNIFKPTNKNFNLTKGKKYLLYLGSELPRKNIENFLIAFKEISKKYPNLILLKAGYSGGNQYRGNTKRLIKELGLRNKVKIVSKRIKEEDLPIYYSNAELFVFPTLQEGFGMPLVESMACGCPVVTSNIAPMNEIAKGQILVDPYNPQDIARGIDYVLSNKKIQRELREKGLKRAKDFDWKKSASKILKIYEELERPVNN